MNERWEFPYDLHHCPFRKMSNVILLPFTQSSCKNYSVTPSWFTLWHIVHDTTHYAHMRCWRYGPKTQLQGPGKEVARSNRLRVYTIFGFVHSPVWFSLFVIHFWRLSKAFWGYIASIYHWTIFMPIKFYRKKEFLQIGRARSTDAAWFVDCPSHIKAPERFWKKN